MKRFGDYWLEKHSYIKPSPPPPLSYRLKDLFPNQWVRFYSLPFGKRYAENEKEYETILYRGNTLATNLFGEDSECWIVVNVLLPLDKKDNPQFSIIKENYSLEKGFEFTDVFEAPENQTKHACFSGLSKWLEKQSDKLLLDIADDTYPRPFWVSKSMNSMFAPYDGGFDLIVFDDDKRLKLRELYVDWSSPRSDGL